MPRSVAMTTGVHEDLFLHLARRDGQEDLCFALYQTSSGANEPRQLLHRPPPSRTRGAPRARQRRLHRRLLPALRLVPPPTLASASASSTATRGAEAGKA